MLVKPFVSGARRGVRAGLSKYSSPDGRGRRTAWPQPRQLPQRLRGVDIQAPHRDRHRWTLDRHYGLVGTASVCRCWSWDRSALHNFGLGLRNSTGTAGAGLERRVFLNLPVQLPVLSERTVESARVSVLGAGGIIGGHSRARFQCLRLYTSGTLGIPRDGRAGSFDRGVVGEPNGSVRVQQRRLFRRGQLDTDRLFLRGSRGGELGPGGVRKGPRRRKKSGGRTVTFVCCQRQTYLIRRLVWARLRKWVCVARGLTEPGRLRCLNIRILAWRLALQQKPCATVPTLSMFFRRSIFDGMLSRRQDFFRGGEWTSVPCY